MFVIFDENADVVLAVKETLEEAKQYIQKLINEEDCNPFDLIIREVKKVKSDE